MESTHGAKQNASPAVDSYDSLGNLQFVDAFDPDHLTSLNPAMGTMGATLPPCCVLHILN